MIKNSKTIFFLYFRTCKLKIGKKNVRKMNSFKTNTCQSFDFYMYFNGKMLIFAKCFFFLKNSMIDLTKTFIFWRSDVPNQKIHTHEPERLTILWVYSMFLVTKINRDFYSTATVWNDFPISIEEEYTARICFHLIFGDALPSLKQYESEVPNINQ